MIFRIVYEAFVVSLHGFFFFSLLPYICDHHASRDCGDGKEGSTVPTNASQIRTPVDRYRWMACSQQNRQSLPATNNRAVGSAILIETVFETVFGS